MKRGNTRICFELCYELKIINLQFLWNILKLLF